MRKLPLAAVGLILLLPGQALLAGCRGAAPVPTQAVSGPLPAPPTPTPAPPPSPAGAATAEMAPTRTPTPGAAPAPAGTMAATLAATAAATPPLTVTPPPTRPPGVSPAPTAAPSPTPTVRPSPASPQPTGAPTDPGLYAVSQSPKLGNGLRLFLMYRSYAPRFDGLELMKTAMAAVERDGGVHSAIVFARELSAVDVEALERDYGIRFERLGKESPARPGRKVFKPSAREFRENYREIAEKGLANTGGGACYDTRGCPGCVFRSLVPRLALVHVPVRVLVSWKATQRKFARLWTPGLLVQCLAKRDAFLECTKMKDMAFALGVFVLAILAAAGCFRPPQDEPKQLAPGTTVVPVQTEIVPPGAAATPARPTATPTETFLRPSPAPTVTPDPTPAAPTPEPRCRHDKMESGLSALMYTRERIKESPPAPGSEIDRLLSRRDIRIGATLNHKLTDGEIAELEAKGIIFDRLPNGNIAGRQFWTGNLAGKWDIGTVIPWDLVCWFSDQDYVFRLNTFSFPGPMPK